MKWTHYLALAFAAAALSGCVETTSTTTAPMADANVPLSDVDACEAAVKRETGNSQVRTLSTESSEANNAVVVGVGPGAAPWRCLVKNGTVADVMSMTDEGKL